MNFNKKKLLFNFKNYRIFSQVYKSIYMCIIQKYELKLYLIFIEQMQNLIQKI